MLGTETPYFESIKQKEMNKKQRMILAIAAMIIGLTAFGLAWYWYDWKLALILFLIILSQNIGNSLKFN